MKTTVIASFPAGQKPGGPRKTARVVDFFPGGALVAIDDTGSR
jgi:hypothetical protein